MVSTDGVAERSANGSVQTSMWEWMTSNSLGPLVDLGEHPQVEVRGDLGQLGSGHPLAQRRGPWARARGASGRGSAAKG